MSSKAVRAGPFELIDKCLPDAVYPTFDPRRLTRIRAPLRVFLWAALCPKSRKEEFRMPGKKPGPSIKRPKTYEALKKKGMSKTRAAKISNAQAAKAK